MHRHRRLLASIALCSIPVFAACQQARPADPDVVSAAADALGGRERVLAVTTVVLEGEGTHYNHGQDMRPDARTQTFAVSGYQRTLDLAKTRARTTITRTPGFAYYQGQQPQTQVQGLDGAAAYNGGPNGALARASAQAAADRRIEFVHHPLVAVRAALAPAAVLSQPRADGDGRAVDVTVDGLAFTLVTDAAGLPRRVETGGAHPNLGDVRLVTRFDDYQEAGGVRLPRRMTSLIDDFVTAEYRLSQHAPSGEVADLAAPPDIVSAAPPAAAAPAVVPERVAPGVWLLAGQSHHSALIEMRDHLLLVDAPQSEARTLAVIAAARGLVADKPLRTLVVSHHHFDHTAGLRAAIAEGLAVVTHDGNRAFVEAMAARPHTRAPDALARTPRDLELHTFADAHEITDGVRTVALYHLADNPHSETMLMVHLPRERVLIQVDAFSPNAAVHPYAANLLQHVRQRQLAVDRIVPLHGAVVPMAALTRAVAQ